MSDERRADNSSPIELYTTGRDIYERLDKQWPIIAVGSRISNTRWCCDRPLGGSFYSIYLLYNNCLACCRIGPYRRVYFLSLNNSGTTLIQKDRRQGPSPAGCRLQHVMPCVTCAKIIFTDNGAERIDLKFREKNAFFLTRKRKYHPCSLVKVSSGTEKMRGARVTAG